MWFARATGPPNPVRPSRRKYHSKGASETRRADLPELLLSATTQSQRVIGLPLSSSLSRGERSHVAQAGCAQSLLHLRYFDVGRNGASDDRPAFRNRFIVVFGLVAWNRQRADVVRDNLRFLKVGERRFSAIGNPGDVGSAEVGQQARPVSDIGGRLLTFQLLRDRQKVEKRILVRLRFRIRSQH